MKIILIVTIALIIYAFQYANMLKEQEECFIWQAHEQEFQNYHSPEGAKEQCSKFGINLK